EIEQPFAVSPNVALHFGQGWEFLAFSLADVEDVHGTEADELLLWFAFVRSVVRINIGRDFVLARPTVADHRSENQNAFLPAFDEAAKRVPRANPGNVSGIRLLPGDQHYIAERVGMESGNRAEILCEHF